MSDQNSIFGNENNSGQPPQNNAPSGGGNTPLDQLTTQLAAIKNERGEQKYKTLEDALKALQHSQEYIPNLKQNSQELEQKLEQAMKEVERVKRLEQVVEQLTQSVGSVQNTTPATIDEGKIAEIVSQTLTKAQQEALQETNQKAVVALLQKSFGEKAEETFYAKAEEVGLSKAQINALARTNPKAALKLVGITGEATTQPITTPQPGLNTAGFTKPADTNITKNKKSVLMGATTQDLMLERQASKALVEELHSKGQSISDLTNPKTFFQHFG